MFNHGYSIFDRGFSGFNSFSLMSVGGIITLALFVILIGLVIYFAVTRNRSHGYHGYQDFNSSENPINIAKLRYAKDEILKRLK